VRGSIRTKVKGKRYEIRVALGLDPKTGRYRQKSLTVRGTRAEAERALRRLLEEVEAGTHEDKVQGSVTFGELLDEWLAFKVSADRSPTTIARYRASIELHLRPSLGTTRLDCLKTKDWLSHVPQSRFSAFWSMLEKAVAPGGRVVMVDDGVRDTHGVARFAEDASGTDANRRLPDGRKVTIVKNAYAPSELEALLADLGWKAEVSLLTPVVYVVVANR
jgi:hypothetical protein